MINPNDRSQHTQQSNNIQEAIQQYIGTSLLASASLSCLEEHYSCGSGTLFEWACKR